MIPIRFPDSLAVMAAAEALSQGDLVAMPTETVYGLAGHALNPKALARIFAVKQRPFFDPLIVHVASIAQAESLVTKIPDVAFRLMERFWPGPLTLVLPRRENIPDLATSGLSTVALRQPHHPVALALLKACGFPLAAPSANPFGALSPTCAEHVASAFTQGITMVLDGGPCTVGVESTILGFEGESARLLRPGGLSVEVLSEVAGPILPWRDPQTDSLNDSASSTRAAMAPGQLPWHYAPLTPMRLLSLSALAAIPQNQRQKRGLLCFHGLSAADGYASAEILSPTGDLVEAASRLFACLHRLDALGLTGIDAEILPKQGLGLAIMDRLEKASRRPGS
jgi:L-threonylcarbamoyladenylate synthase